MANENINDSDSGIASSDVTPINKESSTLMEDVTTPAAAASQREDDAKLLQKMSDSSSDDEEIIDENLYERLVGLMEMFPESLCNTTNKLVSSSFSFLASTYSMTRTVAWCAATTSLLLLAPVIFEVERINAEEMIKQDRNKLVLGPGTAMSGPVGMMPGPPIQ